MARSHTFIANPPGMTIKEQLLDRGMNQKEFAVRMDMSEKHISRLINGEVQLTPDVALRLEVVLGIEAGFWSNLEAIYREKLARIEAENSLEYDEELALKMPYNAMAEFELVPYTDNTRKRVSHLRQYFEVMSLNSLSNTSISKIACHKLEISKHSDLALFAWTQALRLKSRDIDTKAINIQRLNKYLSVIRQMTVNDSDVFYPKLKATMAECGIALVFFPSLEDTVLQGATFIDGKRIVLGLKNNRSDSGTFWFSLFHEIAHIVLGHVGSNTSHNEETSDSDEMLADEWARDILIPNNRYIEFIDNENFSEESITLFAEELGIAPGIVVSRLQADGKINDGSLNYLKTEYNFHL